MFKVAVVGESATVLGFKALGLDVFPVEGEDQTRRALRELLRPDRENPYAIIYLEEGLASFVADLTEKRKDDPSVSVILIPGRNGSLGLAQSELHASVERAVGSDILKS